MELLTKSSSYSESLSYTDIPTKFLLRPNKPNKPNGANGPNRMISPVGQMGYGLINKLSILMVWMVKADELEHLKV